VRDGDEVEVTLIGCEFTRVGDKNTPLCRLMGKTEEGDELELPIWLSEKAAGIARQQFKKAGFEIDKHDLSRLPEFIKSAPRRLMVTVESYERNGNILYRGSIEIGPKASLPKDDLDLFTKYMRESKKNREEEKAPSAPAPRPTPATKPNMGAPIQGVDDGIPFAFILAMLTIVGGALFA